MNPVTSLRPQPGAKPTLLLVEDEFSTRWAAAEFFRAEGFMVVEADDVNDALMVLLSGKSIDAVFSDLRLPGDHGGEFLSTWLEKHRPNIPVLLTSGRTDGATCAGTNPLRRFVVKPYDLREVLRLVCRMLGRGIEMPD
ncbi:MAG TPA: response regulator [Steroidobacteraceae bacterium]|nr:response regulator [Steroidobacteraceae bacterium]